MHINELQGIVRRLSNCCWCRYWCHFNYPQNPVQMAIECVDMVSDKDGASAYRPVPMRELLSRGFAPYEHNKTIYVIDRTNEDGTPYVSTL